MRFIGFLLSFLMLVQYTSFLNAYATSASFDTSGGGISADVPVNKIGALLLADATAILSSTTIEIKAKGPDGNQQTVLQGTILNASMVGTHLKGIAFFQSGPQLSSLCSGGSERIKTTSGEIIEGAISNVTAAGLSCGGKQVPASKLACVDSPCAYEFNISASGAASKISFSQCNVKVAAEKVKKVSEHGTATKVIIGVVIVAAIATAIAVPIAVGCTQQRRRERERKLREQNNLAAVLIYNKQHQPVTSQVVQQISSPSPIVDTHSSSSTDTSSSSSSFRSTSSP